MVMIEKNIAKLYFQISFSSYVSTEVISAKILFDQYLKKDFPDSCFLIFFFHVLIYDVKIKNYVKEMYLRGKQNGAKLFLNLQRRK